MKKGFTLIELLAVIVILAIISLIAIPIVLNIIEDARKSSIADSAYGYKDAITKFFASELISNSEFDIADITYTVSNGNLQNNDTTYNIEMNGQKPNSGSVEIINRVVANACLEYDDYAVTIVNGSVNEVVIGSCDGLAISTEELVTEVHDFDYVQNGENKEQTLSITKSGYYRLEVWGAQGGSGSSKYIGGYGGYSVGVIYLAAGTELYINVGGQGSTGVANVSQNYGGGGYNGGGTRSGYGCSGCDYKSSGGGGATHIALHTGLLSSFDTNGNNLADDEAIDDLLIVAGGGGGNGYVAGGWNVNSTNIPSGGGFKGNYGALPSSDRHGEGGEQTAVAHTLFGQGKNCSTSGVCDGGGGGFYGGDLGYNGAGGGSGYIGNSNLTNKAMYCYKCTESTDASTKTISIVDTSTAPIPYYAKEGNGHARITYVGSNANSVINGVKVYFGYLGKQEEYTVTRDGYYKLEVWGASGGSANSTYKGGYGGYSVGVIRLNRNDKIYINAGGAGTTAKNNAILGAYNGGGQARTSSTEDIAGGGGGATHIATKTGLLSALSGDTDKVLIVAGGGGGAYYYNLYNSSGGSGGGFQGGAAPTGTCTDRTLNNGTPANLTIAGTNNGCGIASSASASFGLGGSSGHEWYAGGGAGFYGGGFGYAHGANGGSGYINSNLSNKYMFCYGCTETDTPATMTISTTGSSNLKDTTNCSSGYSKNPISKCAKEGNGYAVLTYLGSSAN